MGIELLLLYEFIDLKWYNTNRAKIISLLMFCNKYM